MFLIGTDRYVMYGCRQPCQSNVECLCQGIQRQAEHECAGGALGCLNASESRNVLQRATASAVSERGHHATGEYCTITGY